MSLSNDLIDFNISNTQNLNQNNRNNSFSLLLPYYATDKWTNKLKIKVKTLADAYNDFCQKIDQDPNNQFTANQFSKYNKIKLFQNKTTKNLLKNDKNNLFFYPQNKNSDDFFNKTSIGFVAKNNPNNFQIDTEIANDPNYLKNQLNDVLPPVTNFNPNQELNYIEENNFYKTQNLFCISDQQKNQRANMNKFYNNHNKQKDIFYYGNHKPSANTNNLFSSRGHKEEFNKFLADCQSNTRISFFKKNDYNPQIKASLSQQPKDRRQISAMKDVRKKQYLDYIKAKSEDNYMKFYYYQ